MGGIENVRGIFYQHAHSVRTALDVVADPALEYVMVEGTEDVMDIAVFDRDHKLVLAKQVKTRTQAYTWGRSELLGILNHWLALDQARTASFQFVTDGRLGPTGQLVKDALEAAAAGDLEPGANLLDLPQTAPAVVALARCSIHRDELGVEPVIAEAEREVKTLHVPSGADGDFRAQSAIDKLFFNISKRAGAAQPADRTLSTQQILELIDGTVAVEPRNRWDAPLRMEYLAAVASLQVDPLVAVSAVSLDATGNPRSSAPAPTPIIELLDPQLATLSGRTGTGKTTATQLIRAAAAQAQRPVALVHAEAYVPARLDSLVAEGLSAVIGRDLPALTGRQALADNDVTIIIDGVSEVPESVRDALATELRAATAAGSGSRIIAVGRDIAALRAVFSVSANLSRFELKAFDPAQRKELAIVAFSGTTVDPSVELRKAEHALGDMASNPMLLTMALRLLAAGADFHDRASLYEGVIDEMAARTGATSISITAAALGIVYADLLDEERRYASGYEWQIRIAKACEVLRSRGVDADPTRVRASADQSGLVTHIGHTQIRIPAHDSFADYLAGVAHSSNLRALPVPLRVGDDQRVLFAAEHGGVTAESATAVARDLPFLAVRLARYDRRAATSTTPTDIAELLHILVPGTDSYSVKLWAAGHRLVASLTQGHSSSWVDPDEGRELMHSTPTAVVDAPIGPLAIAVRLWAFHVREQLKDSRQPAPSAAVNSLSDAICAVAQHTTAYVAAVTGLVYRTFTEPAQTALTTQMGPLGMHALLYASPSPFSGPNDFAVAYAHTHDVQIRAATSDEIDALESDRTALADTDALTGSTRTSHILRTDPHATATKNIREAANKAATVEWL